MLRPLHERLKTSEKLLADEALAPVLDPGRGRTKTASSRPPPVATDRGTVPILRDGLIYAPRCKAERPIAHLADFYGVL